MPSEPSSPSWVVLDLGETLLDETRCWRLWAQHLGVPEFTFFAMFGVVIDGRRPHTDVFDLVSPGTDWREEVRRKESGPLRWEPTVDDLYPDALPTIERLRADGYRVAVMANQPLVAEHLLAQLPLDAYGTSKGWGVAKPDPAFFARVAQEVGEEPERIVYVGDRVDNDVLPSRAAGMTAVHLRRGPWGVVQADWPEAVAADLHLRTLAELPDALASLRARS